MDIQYTVLKLIFPCNLSGIIFGALGLASKSIAANASIRTEERMFKHVFPYRRLQRIISSKIRSYHNRHVYKKMVKWHVYRILA